MSTQDNPTIAHSDLYEVPRANTPDGRQVRPSDATESGIYTCSICHGEVVLAVSSTGNQFFRHKHGKNTCRAEPAIHWAARKILRALIDRARQNLTHLEIRVPCRLCKCGNPIRIQLGNRTNVDDMVLYEQDIAQINTADLIVSENSTLLNSFVVNTKSAKSANLRTDIHQPWIEFDAKSIKGSNSLRLALYGQKKSVKLHAIDSSITITCPTCHAQEERKKREEEELQKRINREKELLHHHAHALATRLTRMGSWEIALPEKCQKCSHNLTVTVSRSFYNESKPLVRDHENHFWHAGLIRDSKVVLGLLVVQTATFDGPAQLNGTIPYAIVPLLPDPFKSRNNKAILITKHVKFMKPIKKRCLNCLEMEQNATELKRPAEAQRIARQREKTRTEAARKAELAQQLEIEGKVEEARLFEFTARQKAEAQQQQAEDEQRQIRAAEIAAELERRRYEKSPKGQLEALQKTIDNSLKNLDKMEFFIRYRAVRRAIAAHHHSDPSTTILASEIKQHLDKIAKSEWPMIQKREREMAISAEIERQNSEIEASWNHFVSQLKYWEHSKDWTLTEEGAIDAIERLLIKYPSAKKPDHWKILADGRKGRRLAHDIRHDILSRS